MIIGGFILLALLGIEGGGNRKMEGKREGGEGERAE